MTRPEPDPVEDREPSEEESDGEDTDNHEPGMDDCKDYEARTTALQSCSHACTRRSLPDAEMRVLPCGRECACARAARTRRVQRRIQNRPAPVSLARCSCFRPARSRARHSPCAPVQVQCKLAAREFLMNVRGMDEDEARRFIRENVEWLVCSASWEDAGEARGADVMVTFKFGKAPVDASLDYHHRIRWSEVEHMCKFTWNGTGNGNTTILQKTKFMLKATHVKAAREHCLPEGWPAAEAMEFIYRCAPAL